MTVESGEAYDAQNKLDSIIEQMGDLETVFNTLFFIQERLRAAMDTTTDPRADTLHEVLEQPATAGEASVNLRRFWQDLH